MWLRLLLYSLPLAVLLGAVYYVYSAQATIQELTASNAQLTVQNTDLKQDLVELKRSIDRQLEELKTVNNNLKEANEQAKKNLEAFEDSDLGKLTDSKPLLIERIINEGTKDVFKSFEDESRNK